MGQISLDTNVRKAISQTKIFDRVGYGPHAVQRQLHVAKRDHRFRVLPAGRRTGKSTAGGHELTTAAHVAHAVRNSLEPKGKRHEYWIVGPEYTDAEKEFRVLYNDITRLGMPMDKPGTYYDAVGGNMHLSMWGGRFLVHAKSAKYPGTLVGEGLMGLIMAEAAKLKPNVWTKYCRPMLADYAREKSWALFSTTPEGKNWLYDQFMRGQSTDVLDDQWWSLRMPSWSNDILFPGGRQDPEILEMERDMTEEKFKQEIGAEFTEFVGRVFKRFNEEDHVRNLSYDPRWPLFIAQDAGFSNPSVALFVQVDVFNNVRVIAEYYQTHRQPGEFAADVWEDPRLGPLARAASLLYPDPADPGTAATIADKWQVKSMGGTGGELNDRLDLIRRWLKPDPILAHLEDGDPEKIPKMLIDRSCVNLIREMNDYRYPETREEASGNRNASEHPLKKDDHTPEALGRFFVGHFGHDELPNEQATQSEAVYG